LERTYNRKERNMKKIIFMIFMIMIFLNQSCSKRKEMGNNKEEVVPVVVEPVKVEKIRRVLRFTGDIKGIEEVDVFPKVQGKLIENKVKEGSRVTKGAVIALVDRDISGMKYEPFEVTSPISGVVAKVFLDNGAVVVPPTMSTTMGTPIARIVNMSMAKIVINVTDKDYPLVKPGQRAEIMVDAYPNRIFTGKISTIAPIINPYTKTAPAEIIIPNSDLSLRSGMFAKVNLITEEREGIVILSDYVFSYEGKNYVYVNNNSIAERRWITTGIVEDNRVEVLSGLQKGDMVITVGAEMLRDGKKISVSNGGEK